LKLKDKWYCWAAWFAWA